MGNLGKLKKKVKDPSPAVMERAILEALQENDVLTFNDLALLVPGFGGDHVIGDQGKNKIFWLFVSESFGDLFFSLLFQKKIEAYPCNVCLYAAQGNLPGAVNKDTGENVFYKPVKSVDEPCKERKWLPLVITLPGFLTEENREAVTGFTKKDEVVHEEEFKAGAQELPGD